VGEGRRGSRGQRFAVKVEVEERMRGNMKTKNFKGKQ
jgi:hypothetical protein